MKVKEIIKIVNNYGYIEVRQKGSHKQFKNADGKMVTIPMHNGDIPIGTVNAILKSIGAKK